MPCESGVIRAVSFFWNQKVVYISVMVPHGTQGMIGVRGCDEKATCPCILYRQLRAEW